MPRRLTAPSGNPRQEFRSLFVSDTLFLEAAQQRRSHPHDRDFTSPLSIPWSNGVPRSTSFSLNQTETPGDSSRSCSSLAVPLRSSHAWQRKTSRRSGRDARFSALCRTGGIARTSAGVYTTDEPTCDQLQFHRQGHEARRKLLDAGREGCGAHRLPVGDGVAAHTRRRAHSPQREHVSEGRSGCARTNGQDLSHPGVNLLTPARPAARHRSESSVANGQVVRSASSRYEAS